MSYFQAKADLAYIIRFRQDVYSLWRLENEAASRVDASRYFSERLYKNQVRQVAQESKEYQVVRSQVARGLNRAIHMAQKLGVPIDMTSVPPPAGGGHIVEFDMFSAVLHDPSHGGIERQLIVDALNRTEGECETAVKQQFRRLINPFYWLLELLSFVLRIPFLIVSSTGFDVSKIEDQFFGKSLKLVLAALILYLLIKLGFTKEELLEWLSRIW